jgi:hypothetical protein
MEGHTVATAKSGKAGRSAAAPMRDLRPIRSRRQHQAAVDQAFMLSEAAESRRLTRDEADRLELLTILIEHYERVHDAFGGQDRTPL